MNTEQRTVHINHSIKKTVSAPSLFLDIVASVEVDYVNAYNRMCNVQIGLEFIRAMYRQLQHLVVVCDVLSTRLCAWTSYRLSLLALI